METETLESYRLCDILGEYPNLTNELYLSDELDLSELLPTKTTAKMRLNDAREANDHIADTSQIWILDYILNIEQDMDGVSWRENPCDSFYSLEAYNFDCRGRYMLQGTKHNDIKADSELEALSIIVCSKLFKVNDKDLPAIRLWAKQNKEWYDLCDNWQDSVITALCHGGSIKLDDAIDCLTHSLEPILFGSVELNYYDGSAQFYDHELNDRHDGFIFGLRSELELCPNFYKGFGDYAQFGFILTSLIGDVVDSCYGFYDYRQYWTMEIAKQIADNLPNCLLNVALNWKC